MVRERGVSEKRVREKNVRDRRGRERRYIPFTNLAHSAVGRGLQRQRRSNDRPGDSWSSTINHHQAISLSVNLLLRVVNTCFKRV